MREPRRRIRSSRSARASEAIAPAARLRDERLVLPVRFVFLRPRNPENVGAIARALKNFGFADWALVDPAPLDWDDAKRVAVHAEDTLAAARRCTLEEALADCAWVVGTTSRQLPGRRRLFPRELAQEAARRAPGGRLALVFGDERSGLNNQDVDRCHDLSCIPSGREQPSFNLAQATLLYAYELSEAGAARVPVALPRAADVAALGQVESALGAALRGCGFLREGEERHAVRDLMATLERARLTRADAELWNAAWRSVAKRVPQ